MAYACDGTISPVPCMSSLPHPYRRQASQGAFLLLGSPIEPTKKDY